MVIGGINLFDTATLGFLTVTFRWTEGGNDLTHVEQIALTALTNSKPFVFPVHTDPDTECTWEASVTGLVGSFSAQLACVEV
jgi:hypothetical protein